MRLRHGLLATVWYATAAQAQLPQLPPSANPDRINAEERRRAEERTALPLLPQAPRLVQPPAPPPAAAEASNEIRFMLTAVRFDDSAYLKRADLDALAAPLIGTSVSVADLRALVERVNALYAARGLATARAALPAQDVKDGIVTIRLVEGRVGKISLEGGSKGSRRHADRTLGVASGELADPAQLEGRLRRYNRQNDAQLRARLASGDGFGTTDVILEIADPASLAIDAFVDNNGFASTGALQGGVVIRGYRLLGGADRYSVALVKSRGVSSQSVNYSLPVGSVTRLSLSGSHGTTRLVTAAPASLGIRGTSSSLGGDVGVLLATGARFSASIGAGVQATLSNTDIGGTRVVDNFLLAGSATVALGYTLPGLSLGMQSEIALSRVRERISGTERSPWVWRGSASLAKALDGHGLQARLRGDWQLAFVNDLPGLLQYQIGGARSVRAYAPGIAAGDKGYAVSLELARTFAFQKMLMEPFVFVDAAGIDGPAGRSALQDAGIGLLMQLGVGAVVRAHVARGLGKGERDDRAFGSLTVRF